MKDFAFNGKDLLDHVFIGVADLAVLFEQLLPFFSINAFSGQYQCCGDSTNRQEMSSIKELTELQLTDLGSRESLQRPDRTVSSPLFAEYCLSC